MRAVLGRRTVQEVLLPFDVLHGFDGRDRIVPDQLDAVRPDRDPLGLAVFWVDDEVPPVQGSRLLFGLLCIETFALFRLALLLDLVFCILRAAVASTELAASAEPVAPAELAAPAVTASAAATAAAASAASAASFSAAAAAAAATTSAFGPSNRQTLATYHVSSSSQYTCTHLPTSASSLGLGRGL